MSLAERRSCFAFIRDIPYKIALFPDEQGYSCAVKTTMLGQLLQGLGLKTRRIICAFDWDETPLPSDVLALPRNEGEKHMFLQVFIPETSLWVDCDPTWDRSLGNAGFPVAQWDGMGGTTLAVKPHRLYTEEETENMMRDFANDIEGQKRHASIHRSFYQGINRWMETVRQGKGAA